MDSVAHSRKIRTAASSARIRQRRGSGRRSCCQVDLNLMNSYERENNPRFHRFSERGGWSEFRQREDLPNPAVYFGILRSGDDLIVDDPSFLPDVSLNRQRLIGALFRV